MDEPPYNSLLGHFFPNGRGQVWLTLCTEETLFSKIGDTIRPEQMLFKKLDEDIQETTLEELQRYMRRRRKELAEEGTDRSAARIKLSGGVEFETCVFMENSAKIQYKIKIYSVTPRAHTLLMDQVYPLHQSVH